MNNCSSTLRRLAGTLFSVAFYGLSSVTMAETVYKWADERGIVHYSNHLVPGKTVEQIEILPGPCQEDVQSAKQRAERDKREAARLQIAREHPPRASPGSALGPLPPNSTSEFVRTLDTGFVYHFRDERLLSQYWIKVRTASDLPVGAYLEFHFEDPVHYDRQFVTGKTVHVNAHGVKVTDFAVLSPEFEGIQCRNYVILVEVYRNRAKRVLLGRHRQIDQSRVDASLVSSPADLLGRLGASGKCCP